MDIYVLDYLHAIEPLSDGLRQHLENILKTRHVKKKEILLRPGHISCHIYFITKGLLRAYYIKNSEVEISSWFMKEGDVVVSIESFYQQKESFEYIEALEDTDLFYIEHSELEYIYKHFKEFNTIGRVLTIKYLILWAQQLRMLRMNNAQERYDWLKSNFADILHRVPQNYLATFMDKTPVTFSNTKKRDKRHIA